MKNFKTGVCCKTILHLILLSCIANIAAAQIINTIAGNGTAGWSGDGGQATAANINNPSWIIVDGAGNYFFADRSGNRIRKVNTSGIISTVAGNGTASFGGDGGAATSAALNSPTSVAIDATGNLYIGDMLNHRIRKINSSGIISTYAGTGSAGFSGDGGAATAAELNYPYGIVFDGSGNLIFCDEYNHCIRKINTAGIITTIAGTGASAGYGGDGGPATACQMNYPHYISIDASGNLFITDNSNHRIRRINTSGIITTYVGTGTAGFSGDGGPATAANINFSGGTKLDGAGNLYVTDALNHRIRVVSGSGIISTFAGTGVASYSGDGGLASAASFDIPHDIAFDASGNMLIADYSNNRIRRISYNTPPSFTGGASQSLTMCRDQEPIVINARLAITDPNVGQTETWTINTPPGHGALGGFSTTATATGDTLTPTGLIYGPTAGFSGLDSFKIMVSDGMASDLITIYVTVTPPPSSGVISGTDSVCVGDTVTLSETVTGGIWNTTNSTISTVPTPGRVVGVSAGLDSVMYTVTGTCGTNVSYFHFKVRSKAACDEGVSTVTADPSDKITITPNPSRGAFSVMFSSESGEDARSVIFDALGRKVYEMTITPNRKTDLQLHLASGIYLISATTGKSFTTAKITVE